MSKRKRRQVHVYKIRSTRIYRMPLLFVCLFYFCATSFIFIQFLSNMKKRTERQKTYWITKNGRLTTISNIAKKTMKKTHWISNNADIWFHWNRYTRIAVLSINSCFLLLRFKTWVSTRDYFSSSCCFLFQSACIAAVRCATNQFIFIDLTNPPRFFPRWLLHIHIQYIYKFCLSCFQVFFYVLFVSFDFNSIFSNHLFIITIMNRSRFVYCVCVYIVFGIVCNNVYNEFISI